MRFTTLATTLFLSSASLFVAARRAALQHNQTIGVQPYGGSSDAELVYYGGPVLSNVKVFTIFWGGTKKVKYAKRINQFYAGITDSVYIDWLSEYNTPTQEIGRGTWIGSYSYKNAPTGTLSDVTIQRALKTLIRQRKVPQPTADTYYAIHLAPGVLVSGQCEIFCTYHWTTKLTKKSKLNINYGVNPDQGGVCDAECGSDTSTVEFDNLCSMASNVLVEVVTDPAVGLATMPGELPTAWFDKYYGEIGDICFGRQELVVGGDGVTYTVQKQFSNSEKKCIVSK